MTEKIPPSQESTAFLDPIAEQPRLTMKMVQALPFNHLLNLLNNGGGYKGG